MMTTLEDRNQQADAPLLDTLHRRNRALIIAVTISSVALLVLAAWVIYDLSTGSDSKTNAEITRLLDDYTAALGPGETDAWNPGAFQGLVTDDFAVEERYYRQFGDTLARHDDVLALDEISVSSTWQLREASDSLVTGDGPWVAARVDNWGDSKSDGWGIGVFVIVDDNGTLKVAEKYWVGIGVDPQ